MTTLTKEELLANLGNKDALVRQHARFILVHQGEENVPALINALGSTNTFTRREATRALANFHTDEVATALTEQLTDGDFSVRWNAMECLLKFGRMGLKATLEAFVKHFDSAWVREGTHHILRVMRDRHSLNEAELELFNVLDEQAHVSFSAGWTGKEAWAAEKALEVFDKEEVVA